MAFDPSQFADFSSQEEFDTVASDYETRRDEAGNLSEGERLNLFFQTLQDHGVKRKDAPDTLLGSAAKGLAKSFTAVPRLGASLIETAGAALGNKDVQTFGQAARESWQDVDQSLFSQSYQAQAEAEAKRASGSMLPTKYQLAEGIGSGVGDLVQMFGTAGAATAAKIGGGVLAKSALKTGLEVAAEAGASGVVKEAAGRAIAKQLAQKEALSAGRRAGLTVAGWKGGASTTDDLRQTFAENGGLTQGNAVEAMAAFVPSFFINGLGDMAIERVLPNWSQIVPAMRGKVMRDISSRVLPAIMTEGSTEALQSSLDAGVKAAFAGEIAIPDGMRGVVRDALFEGIVGGIVGGAAGGAHDVSTSGWGAKKRLAPDTEKPASPQQIPPDGAGSPMPSGPTDLVPSPIQTKQQRAWLSRIPEVSGVVDTPSGARIIQVPGGDIEVSTTEDGNQVLSFLGGKVKGVVRYDQKNEDPAVHGLTQYFNKESVRPEVSGVPVDFLVDIINGDPDTLNHEYYHVFERYVLTREQQSLLDRVYSGGPETRAEAYGQWATNQAKGHPLFKKIQNFARSLWMALTGQMDKRAAEQIFQSVRQQRVPDVRTQGTLSDNVLGFGQAEPELQYKFDADFVPPDPETAFIVGPMTEKKNPYLGQRNPREVRIQEARDRAHRRVDRDTNLAEIESVRAWAKDNPEHASSVSALLSRLESYENKFVKGSQEVLKDEHPDVLQDPGARMMEDPPDIQSGIAYHLKNGVYYNPHETLQSQLDEANQENDEDDRIVEDDYSDPYLNPNVPRSRAEMTAQQHVSDVEKQFENESIRFARDLLKRFRQLQGPNLDLKNVVQIRQKIRRMLGEIGVEYTYPSEYLPSSASLQMFAKQYFDLKFNSWKNSTLPMLQQVPSEVPVFTEGRRVGERRDFMTYVSEQDEAQRMSQRFEAEGRVLADRIRSLYQKLDENPTNRASVFKELGRAFKEAGHKIVPAKFNDAVYKRVVSDYHKRTLYDYLGTGKSSGRFSYADRVAKREFYATVMDDARDTQLFNNALLKNSDMRKLVARRERERLAYIRDLQSRIDEFLKQQKIKDRRDLMAFRGLERAKVSKSKSEVQYKRDEDAIRDLRGVRNVFDVLDEDYMREAPTAWARVKAAMVRLWNLMPRRIFDRYYPLAELDRQLGFDRVHPDSVRSEFQHVPERVAAHFRDFMEGAPRRFDGSKIEGVRNFTAIMDDVRKWGEQGNGSKKGAVSDFISLLHLLNMRDRVRNGMRTGLRSADYYEEAVKLAELQSPFLKEKAEELQILNNHAFYYLVEAGAISEKLFYDTINKHPFFSPFLTPENLLADNVRAGLELSPVLLQQEKYAHAVIDPVTAIVSNIQGKIEAAFKWKAMQRAFKEYESLSDMSGNPQIQRLEPTDPDYLSQVAQYDIEFQRIMDEAKMSGVVGNIAPGDAKEGKSSSQAPESFANSLRFNVALNRTLVEPEKKLIVVPRFEGNNLRYDVYRVLSREVFNVLTDYDVNNSSFIKIVRAVTPALKPFADLMRSMISITPEFFGANIFRDFVAYPLFLPLPADSRLLDAWKVHKKPMHLRGILTFFKRKDVVQAFQESGADFATFIQAAHDYSANAVARQIRIDKHGLLAESIHHPYEAIAQLMSWMVHPLNKFSSLSENMGRLGAFTYFYDQAKAQGMSEEKARAHALTNTKQSPQNFGRGGTYIQELNKICPFLSAGVGGWMRIAEAVQENPKLMRDYAVLIASASIGLMLLNRRDDRWKDIPEYEKDMYWFIMVPDKPIIRIPKPFEAGTFFGSVPERMVEMALEDTPFKAEKLERTLFSFNLPNPIPAAFTPLLQNAMNRDWKGSPVIPRSMEYLSPENQYSPYTSETAKMLASGIRTLSPEFLERFLEKGKLTSPKGIENVMRSYLGGGSRYLAEGLQVPGTNVRLGLDPALRAIQGERPFLNEPERTWSDVPGVRRFVSRQPSTSSQPITDFYEAYGRVESAHSAMLALQKANDRKGLQSFVVKNKPLLLAYKRLQDTATLMNRLNHTLKEVRADQTISPSEKRQRMDRLASKQTRVAEVAVKHFQRITSE